MSESEMPSSPRASRWVRWGIYVLLLVVAVGAIWLIDSGGGKGLAKSRSAASQEAAATQP